MQGSLEKQKGTNRFLGRPAIFLNFPKRMYSNVPGAGAFDFGAPATEVAGNAGKADPSAGSGQRLRRLSTAVRERRCERGPNFVYIFSRTKKSFGWAVRKLEGWKVGKQKVRKLEGSEAVQGEAGIEFEERRRFNCPVAAEG